jgi:hypothetical protein
MHHMATEEPRTSSVVRVHVELVIDPALAELDVRVAQVELEALVGLEDPVVPAVQAALVVPENPVVLVAPGDPVVRAALAGLVVQVVVEPERVPVVVVPERDPVVEEPELVQVAVVLELDPAAVVPGLDPAAVPLKTKSVIGARHRDLAPRLAAEEDLAAGAETTRDPAATEAGTAWVAAV